MNFFEFLILCFYYLGTDNTVATVKVLGVHVHRATLALGTAACTTSQLGQNAKKRYAHYICPTVRSVSCDYRVVSVHRCFHANAHRFLSILYLYIANYKFVGYRAD